MMNMGRRNRFSSSESESDDLPPTQTSPNDPTNETSRSASMEPMPSTRNSPNDNTNKISHLASMAAVPPTGNSPNDDATGISHSASMRPVTCCCEHWKRSVTGAAPNKAAGNSGPERFKVRALSHAERYHLDKARTDPFLEKLSCSRLLQEPFQRLEVWPKFFETPKKSSAELREGLVKLWTTFIVAESLMASVAIQPFITKANLTGWQLDVYGLLWMLALICDYLALGITAIFLGYLHGPPARLTPLWLCNSGAWISVPAVLILSATFTSPAAVAFSSWVIYGNGLGIFSSIFALLAIAFGVVTSTCLGKASEKVQESD